MVFEKKDYYGAQYEVNRFKKLVPLRADSKSKEEEESFKGSRMSRIFEEEESQERDEAQNSLYEGYFSLFFEIIDGVICVLKLKITKGLNIFKEISLKL